MNSLLSIFLLLVALPLSSVMGQVPSDPIIDPPIVIIDPPVVDPPTDGGDAWIDTDSDGMTDDWELANGLDPEDPADADLDTDGDGLANVQEFEFGSDPNAADTDGGGASDYSEWVLSTAIQHALDALAVLVYQSPGSTGSSGDFIGSGSMDMQMSIIHRPLFPIDLVVTDPESENEDVTDPEVGDGESTDPVQDDDATTDNSARIAAAPKADDDSGDDVSIDDPVTDPVVVIDPTQVLDALSELLGNFDPNDDADDEAVTAAVAKLKELKLWQTVQDIASNKIDLTGLLWASMRTPPIIYSMGAAGGPLTDAAGLDGSTSTDAGATATPLDPIPSTTPKAYNFGGGGGGSADVPSTPSNAGGNNGVASSGAASSGGSGGGHGSSAGAGSNGGHSLPHSALVTSAPVEHSVKSISGSSSSRVVATGSNASGDADEHHHHHHDDFGGGGTSSITGSSSSHLSATVIASTTKPVGSGGSSTTTGFAVMSLVSAAGWALRRFLTAAI